MSGLEESDRPGEDQRAHKLRTIHQAYIGVGSNIDPENNLVRCMDFLRQQTRVKELSMVWETPPAGARGPNFLNAVVLVETPLTAPLLKSLILRRIEVQLGRVRTSNKNAPRTIDLDILIFDGNLRDQKVWTHAFVAVPLSELLPNYANSVTGETIEQAARRLAQSSPVKPRADIFNKINL